MCPVRDYTNKDKIYKEKTQRKQISNGVWYVYLLLSKKTDHWYIGSTIDLRKRILKHNSGQNKSTKYGIPWKIIYCELSLNKNDARAREKYLKSGMGRRYLKNRLKFFFAEGF